MEAVLWHSKSFRTLLFVDLYLQMFFAKSHGSGSWPLVSATLLMLGPHWDSSWISYCCPVSRRFCSFGSAGLTPAHCTSFICPVVTTVSPNVQLPYCVQKIMFPCSCLPLAFAVSLPPLLQWSLSLVGGCSLYVPFMCKYYAVFYSLHLSQFVGHGVTHHIVQLEDDDYEGWEMHWSIGIMVNH